MSDQTPYDDRPGGPVSGAHPDVDELSAYADGSLDAAAAGVVGAHVESCAECAGDLRALAFVAGELATLPAPTMPGDVALRLDEAIARERRAHPAADGAPPGRGRGGPSWAAGGAAAAVVIGLVAVIGIGAVVNKVGQGSAAKDATGAAGAPAAGLDREAGPTAVYTSGTDYSKVRLPDQLSTVLDRPADEELDDVAESLAQTPTGSAPVTPATPRAAARDSELTALKSVADPARLKACVETLSPGAQPVAVDFARFEGRPAILIAFPGEGSQLEVYVVGPNCGIDAGTDDSLHYQVVNRP